ncbi:MAG: FtsW/RodA/SpoVE family cell cycle protein [Eubacteriales bacterium]|mgnify:FL=1|jgi:cell division protein FtsW
MSFLSFLTDSSDITETLAALWARFPGLPRLLTQYIRYGLVILAVFTVCGCMASLLREKYSPELWGHLRTSGGDRLPLTHWENILGSAGSSDAVVRGQGVARTHAALTRDAQGMWTLYPLSGRASTLKNGGRLVIPTRISAGDNLTLGGVKLQFQPATVLERREQSKTRTRPGMLVRPWVILLWITEFQILLCAQLVIAAGDSLLWTVIPVFLALTLIMWAYFAFVRAFRRSGFEIEALGFFLTTLGLGVISSSNPDELPKWLLTVVLGLIVYVILCLLLRRLDIAQKLRWLAAAGALGLLLLTLLLGKQNWIRLGGFSFQPSEIAKLCFVYAGTATLDRLFMKRNMILFVVLAAACVGMLAVMSDFGTALIFFATFLVIAFMRSGDFASLLFILAGTVIGGFMVLELKPYIAERFSAWRHVWEYPATIGYQQTRTMSAAASGGLFGMGAGNGWLHRIAAADTDLVFGMVCEEMGLLIALMAVGAVITITLFAYRSASLGRSTFYCIAACAAASSLVMQVLLNVCGSVDILPLTGVTFPFVSNGGSSMLASWGMLAFIKAADTREGASIAVRREKKD